MPSGNSSIVKRNITGEDKIAISVINLGYLATEYPLTTPVDEVIEKVMGN